ncbi:MAG: hypothetical protein ACOC2P_02885 [Spirochaetota bacterium]
MYITSIMVSIGSSIILAGLVYILLVKKMHNERSSATITEQVRAEIDRMIVDLNQTADRNIGLIEQRLMSLGELIKEADHRISLLQKQADNLSKSMDTYSRLRPGTMTNPSSPSASKPAAGTAVEHTPQPESLRPKKSEKSEKPAEGVVGQSKRERVISLYRQGISVDIIASRVDSTVAEVELIISMTEGKR